MNQITRETADAVHAFTANEACALLAREAARAAGLPDDGGWSASVTINFSAKGVEKITVYLRSTP